MKHSLPPRKDIPSFWRETKTQVYLHLGENPYTPTPHVLQSIYEAAQNANRYPDTNAIQLREALADYVGHGVSPHNILVGNGSDELIDLAVVTFCIPGQKVLTFEPSFFVYQFAAHRHDIYTQTVRRTATFALPPLSHITQDERSGVALTFVANPNNPTGTLSPREQLVRYINDLPGILVIDECYYEFSEETLVDLIHKYKNLIIFRSLSKSFGLSGLRLGYMVAHEELIQTLERFAMTFPVNALAQAAAIAALEDHEIYQKRIYELIHRRNQLAHELTQLGLQVFPSHTNFLLALFDTKIENPAQQLAQKGFLVSDQTANLGLKQSALRLAIGTEQENQRLIETIKKIVQS